MWALQGSRPVSHLIIPNKTDELSHMQSLTKHFFLPPRAGSQQSEAETEAAEDQGSPFVQY